jgi:hypothetical protein
LKEKIYNAVMKELEHEKEGAEEDNEPQPLNEKTPSTSSDENEEDYNN